MRGALSLRCFTLLMAGLCLTPIGCGDEVRKHVELEHIEAAMMVRVLDPGGRLFLHPENPDCYCYDADADEVLLGRSTHYGFGELPIFTFDHVPDEGEIVVVAPGCRTARVKPRSGEIIVRLEAGIPVTLRIETTGRLGDPKPEVGVSLEWRYDLFEGRRSFGRGHNAISVSAAWMEHDRPANRDYTVFEWPGGDVKLYVPDPGTYCVHWEASWPNVGSHAGSQVNIEVGEGDANRVYEVKVDASRFSLPRGLRGKLLK